MEYEIIKLIYDYSINKRLADNDFINRIIEIVSRERNLDKYVKDVEFSSISSKSACGCYNPLLRKIVINPEAIEHAIEKTAKYDCLFSDIEQYMLRNVTIARIVLHELEHATQYKSVHNRKDKSLETELLKVCYNFELYAENPVLIWLFKKKSNHAN